MYYPPSPIAIAIFLLLVSSILALSFYLGKRAKSAKGNYAAPGEIPWFINSVAFAGDYLSAASFLGICGYIAYYGYDGFLYSIGLLAGWVVALFLIAEPIKRLGKYTFADALDSRFNSRGIKFAAALSTLLISIFYLIPQMVGAGSLIKPLLGIPDTFLISSFSLGVILVGGIVILIVVTAGMVLTTWVQFIKGFMLVLFCGLLTLGIFHRGLTVKSPDQFPRRLSADEFHAQLAKDDVVLSNTGAWEGHYYVRVKHHDGSISVWKFTGMWRYQPSWPAATFTECQMLTITPAPDSQTLVNGLPKSPTNDLKPAGFVASLPEARQSSGSLGPVSFLSTIQDSDIGLPKTDKITDSAGTHTIYYTDITTGQDILLPGNHPTLFKGIKSGDLRDQLNFLSLMLALFCGTAALPHLLIRYYTIKDQASARKSMVVGIAAIGLFYILTLYLGLGAMTAGTLEPDPANSNMAAPLLAKSFGNLAFALISASAFTIVLGTVSDLIIAASGTVARDLLHNLLKFNLDDRAKVRAGKIASVIVGIIAIALGILFQKMNVAFLVGWAFNIAASANLPAITMLLFWRRTTRQGITASILVGLFGSLIWIFLSTDAFEYLYGYSAADALAASRRWHIPFNQPALVTIPLAYATLILVSLLTPKPALAPDYQSRNP